jgi:hypothetical protein
MAGSSGLAQFCVYTIVSTERFEEARLAGEPWRFKEAKRWTTAAGLWADAFDQGLRMAVLFGNAAHCSCLIGWGILTGLNSADDGTRCIISDLRTIPGNHKTQELILRSTGDQISPGFIKPYAICQTPAFLGRRNPG